MIERRECLPLRCHGTARVARAVLMCEDSKYLIDDQISNTIRLQPAFIKPETRASMDVDGI